MQKWSSNYFTSDPADGTPITIFSGLTELPHSFPPNVDENIADQLATSIERKAEEHTEQPRAQLLWTELQGVEVLNQLPSQPVLVRAMQRIRWKEVLSAPTKLWYHKEIPDRYKKTLLYEQFLLHDSGPSPQSSCMEDLESEEEQKEKAGPRVMVFTTQKNFKILVTVPYGF